MSIPVYVVSDDQLVDRSVLGDRLYAGTTAVVKEADAIELARRSAEEAIKAERGRIVFGLKALEPWTYLSEETLDVVLDRTEGSDE